MPQFYLRNWTTESGGKLWRCARMPRGNLHDQPSSPKATGFERDLYTLSDTTPLVPAGDRYLIEDDFFKKIDNDAAGALNTLLTAGVTALDEAARTAWALFLSSLLERTPHQLLAMDAKAKAIVDQSYEKLQADSDPEGRARFSSIMGDDARSALARNHVRYRMVARIQNPVMLDHLKRLRWVIANNTNPDFEFITTDAPLVVNYGDQGPKLDVLAISLNPQRLFFAYPSSWNEDGEYLETLGMMAFVHNVLLLEQPCNFVYSRSKLEDGDIIKLRKATDLFLTRRA